MTYTFELEYDQVEPLVVKALKESIIDESFLESDDLDLLTSLHRTLRYFTTLEQYQAILAEIEEAVDKE